MVSYFCSAVAFGVECQFGSWRRAAGRRQNRRSVGEINAENCAFLSRKPEFTDMWGSVAIGCRCKSGDFFLIQSVRRRASIWQAESGGGSAPKMIVRQIDSWICETSAISPERYGSIITPPCLQTLPIAISLEHVCIVILTTLSTLKRRHPSIGEFFGEGIRAAA